MTPQLAVTDAAWLDLMEHVDYIAGDDVAAALRLREAAEAAFGRLAAMPRLGRRRKFRRSQLEGLRSWPIPGFSNYLIFHRPIEDGVEIVRVLHGAKDIDRLLGD